MKEHKNYIKIFFCIIVVFSFCLGVIFPQIYNSNEMQTALLLKYSATIGDNVKGSVKYNKINIPELCKFIINIENLPPNRKYLLTLNGCLNKQGNDIFKEYGVSGKEGYYDFAVVSSNEYGKINEIVNIRLAPSEYYAKILVKDIQSDNEVILYNDNIYFIVKESTTIEEPHNIIAPLTTPIPQITIINPENKSKIYQNPVLLSGKVSDSKLNVYIFIRSMLTGLWYVQESPILNNSGDFDTLCYFNKQNKIINEFFQLVLVTAKDTDIWQKDTIIKQKNMNDILNKYPHSTIFNYKMGQPFEEILIKFFNPIFTIFTGVFSVLCGKYFKKFFNLEKNSEKKNGAKNKQTEKIKLKSKNKQTIITDRRNRKDSKLAENLINNIEIEKEQNKTVKVVSFMRYIKDNLLYFSWLISILILLIVVLFLLEFNWILPSIFISLIIIFSFFIFFVIMFLIISFSNNYEIKWIIIYCGIIIMIFSICFVDKIIPHYIHINNHPKNVRDYDIITGNTTRLYNWKILLLVHHFSNYNSKFDPNWYIQQPTIPDANGNWQIDMNFDGPFGEFFDVLAIASTNDKDISELSSKKTISLLQIPDTVYRSNIITVKKQ